MTSPTDQTNFSMRRVLVTGGAGFIGSHLVERLAAQGLTVTIIDDLSTGRRSNLDAVADRVRFIEADLLDGLAMLRSEEHFDAIYHMAAVVGVRLVLSDPIRSIETNVGGTSAVLHYAEKCGKPAVLIASSSEVYGKPSHSTFNEDDDTVYGPTTTTRWSYAASKALDEHLAMAFDRLRGVPVVIARLFNTVGPRQVGSYGMVVPNFVGSALGGKPMQVHGDGAQTRCFCDVRDVVAALTTLVGSPTTRGRVFNVGGDEPISIMQLAQLVNKTLATDAPIETIPYDMAYPQGFEDLLHRRPDLTRLREAVGFEREFSFEQTIQDVAEGHRLQGCAAKKSEGAA